MKSEKLDAKIKKLLFANPTIGLEKSKQVIASLNKKSDGQKKKLVTWLQQNLNIYRRKMKREDSTYFNQQVKIVNEHIKVWDKEVNKVTLEDVCDLMEDTELSIIEVGWNLVSLMSLIELMDTYMEGQDKYKEELAMTVYNHMIRIKHPNAKIPKRNQLVYGPSGVGKTSGILTLAKKLGITACVQNLATVVPEGIQGSCLSTSLTQTLHGKIDNLLYVWDEVDKGLSPSRYYGETVLAEALVYLDDKNVVTYPESFGSNRRYIELSTHNITIILCGKYSALCDEVKKRIGSVGFYGTTITDEDELYKYVELADLRKVLRSDELCGRIGNYVGVHRLTEEQMINVLMKKKETIVSRFTDYFDIHNIDLTLTYDGAQAIAQHALLHSPDLGVRAMEPLMWRILRNEIFKGKASRKRIVKLDKAYVMPLLEENVDVELIIKGEEPSIDNDTVDDDIDVWIAQDN